MSISIQAKTDYSSLLSSLSSSSSSSTSSTSSSFSLIDYASIKNGSYAKLLKAYYSSQDSDDDSSSSTSSDAVSALEKVSTTGNAFTDVANELTAKGSSSVFNKVEKTTTDEYGNETTTSDYDVDAIYSSVEDFVKTYNNFINKAKSSSNSSVARQADSLANMVTTNYSLLKNIGIDIDDDDSLVIDEDEFKNADMDEVKNLFYGNQSLASQIATKVNMIATSAKTAANTASGYTSSGTYTDSYSVGSLLDSIV